MGKVGEKNKNLKMIKYYCDACQKEETESLFDVPIYVHIKDENRLMGHAKIIDGKMQPFSGRTENIQLCLVCYNKVMPPLLASILEIKKAATEPRKL